MLVPPAKKPLAQFGYTPYTQYLHKVQIAFLTAKWLQINLLRKLIFGSLGLVSGAGWFYTKFTSVAMTVTRETFSGCHFAPNQLRDLKFGLFGSVAINLFIFCAQKCQKCTIHFVPMLKQKTMGWTSHCSCPSTASSLGLFQHEKQKKI